MRKACSRGANQSRTCRAKFKPSTAASSLAHTSPRQLEGKSSNPHQTNATTAAAASEASRAAHLGACGASAGADSNAARNAFGSLRYPRSSSSGDLFQIIGQKNAVRRGLLPKIVRRITLLAKWPSYICTMRALLALFLGMLLVGQNAYNLARVAHYAWAYDHYATVLCENQNRPELHCNGACHLKKELAESPSPQAPTLPEIESLSFWAAPALPLGSWHAPDEGSHHSAYPPARVPSLRAGWLRRIKRPPGACPLGV